MVLKILLITAILLQLVAVVTAVRLMRVTKYNSSWVLFTVALASMTLQLLGQFAHVSGVPELRFPPHFFAWTAVVTSFCIALGMLLVYKIFNYVGKTESQRRLTEKRILSTVLRTEEKERMRFAKELHDGMGPLLSSARMQLSSLDASALPPADAEALGNARYVIDEAIRSLREISNNLSPHTLRDFGLSRAVSNFIGKVQSGDLRIEFDTNLNNERFDIDVETILYRVVCELINNSIKHSGGSCARIDMQYTGSHITLDYSDDGVGFNPEAVMDVGMGLSNIVSRVSSLKGECRISSAGGGGMRAAIRIDLDRHRHGHRR